MVLSADHRKLHMTKRVVSKCRKYFLDSLKACDSIRFVSPQLNCISYCPLRDMYLKSCRRRGIWLYYPFKVISCHYTNNNYYKSLLYETILGSDLTIETKICKPIRRLRVHETFLRQ
jgi:hypothetical protein